MELIIYSCLLVKLKLFTPKCCLRQICNYFVTNCRMYVKEYLDINKKMTEDQGGSREVDSEVA